MKLFYIWIVTFLLSFLLVEYSFAGEIDVHIEWSYNGPTETTEGFRLYQKSPDSTEVIVADIVGGETRSWDGVLNAEVGRSIYYLTAYGTLDGEYIESPKSTGYPFEYIEPLTPGLPAPTVIIRFN